MRKNKNREYNKKVFVNLITSLALILTSWCAFIYLVLNNNEYNNIQVTTIMILPIITILGIIMLGIEYSDIKDED